MINTVENDLTIVLLIFAILICGFWPLRTFATSLTDHPTTVIPIQITRANVPDSISGTVLNTPMVSIEICKPGSDKCATVSNILLDTGSVGLRLFSSVINLNLPQVRDHKNHLIAEEIAFNGAECWWGPVVKADIKLGNQKILGIGVHQVDDKFKFRPSECAPVEPGQKDSGLNGILGVGPNKFDCNDFQNKNCPSSVKQYFSCDSQSCRAASVTEAEEVSNPIASLPIDNNGFIIKMPALTSVANIPVTGSLILGIGTTKDNQPTLKEHVVKTDRGGNFLAFFQGKVRGSAVIDSGTPYNFLPGISGVQGCPMAVSIPPLCPDRAVDVDLGICNKDGSGAFPIKVRVENYMDELNSATNASDGITTSSEMPDYQDSVFLGLSFFFGKSIYFGLSGKSSALGVGPYFAFGG